MTLAGEEKKTQQAGAGQSTGTAGNTQQVQGATENAGAQQVQNAAAKPETQQPQDTTANTTAQQTQNTQPAATLPQTRTEKSTNRSAAYEKAMTALKQAEKSAPTYSSSYDDEINEIYSKITSREPFKYDYSTDPLYGQYREQYTQLGKQAMKDSMGQTAALTGGYGNSYGSAVGQQQYDAYLQRLNDVMPELYGQAYDIYKAEGDTLRQQYALATDRRDTEYNHWRDELGDWRYDTALDTENAQKLASDLAAYGDFSGYAELYGDEAAKQMAQTWATANPLPAYMNGLIDAEQYYQITGKYPIGYVKPGSGGGSSGGGGASGGWDPGNHMLKSKQIYYYNTGDDLYNIKHTL